MVRHQSANSKRSKIQWTPLDSSVGPCRRRRSMVQQPGLRVRCFRRLGVDRNFPVAPSALGCKH